MLPFVLFGMGYKALFFSFSFFFRVGDINNSSLSFRRRFPEAQTSIGPIERDVWEAVLDYKVYVQREQACVCGKRRSVLFLATPVKTNSKPPKAAVWDFCSEVCENVCGILSALFGWKTRGQWPAPPSFPLNGRPDGLALFSFLILFLSPSSSSLLYCTWFEAWSFLRWRR